uniref:Uncharacterized protein TCIL3000_6_2540 n=1 Tax=Trypanosoma congolense (strain IL3000) TaxID=1068625 RepID=G0UNQ2_TRYCI|nr:unnamed protein product [Trypanosoma congolense IL3000]
MAPPPAKKMRSKRATTSRAANRLQPDSNCTEALIAAMDEKKRAKVSTMLGNFFKREIHDQGGSACYTPQPPAAQCLPSPAMQVLTTTAQAVEPRPTAPTNDSSKLFSSSGVNTRDLCSSFTDHNPNSQRRHRDVPPEIWEEMVKLRLKRLYLEEQIASLVTSIDAQTERFHCLMQIQAIGQYVTDGVLPSGGFVRKKKR